jgi:hypothetical protein
MGSLLSSALLHLIGFRHCELPPSPRFHFSAYRIYNTYPGPPLILRLDFAFENGSSRWRSSNFQNHTVILVLLRPIEKGSPSDGRWLECAPVNGIL